ncbi:MAG: penicillin acylase family protein, partial [Acidimicrobiia bacterium]
MKRVLVFLLFAVLVFTAYGVYTVRRSFPQVKGELEVDGLHAPVEVLRDSLGVPHIYADNQHDLFFAQGYTHAQDRFWQMDFWRHIGAGRLSEMFGESQVDTDRFLRSLGFEALANEEWQDVSARSREILESYAQGVNAYLADRAPAAISLEYAVLPLQSSGYRIEQWSPTDTLMWAKVMSWDLGGNLEAEIARAVLGQDLGRERVEQLYPSIADDKPVIVETDQVQATSVESPSLPRGAFRSLASAGSAAERLWALTGGGFEGIGSNNWVISGSMTQSGMPLLANDTHLAIQMPSIWYGIGLHCDEVTSDCPFESVGFSFAGTPGVIIGHNGHHAWGVTNQAADTQDLFIERTNPENPRQYEVDGAWVDFEIREETIAVAGSEDLTFEVLTSRHGPVISNTYLEPDELDGSTVVDLPDDYAVALAWQTLEPSTIVDGILGINMAGSYQEFAEAASLWDIAPQNLVYADVEGNIAYYPTGEIPVRAAGDGRYPVPGWTSEFEWVGLVPEDDKPVLLNPAQGYIESANQPILRPGSTPFFGTDGALGYRGARIDEMIRSSSGHTVSTLQE